MHRIFIMRKLVFLIFFLILVEQVPQAFAKPLVVWSPWSYNNAPANPPTTGNGATRWATDGNFLWQVDASTWSSVPLYGDNSIAAYVFGYDRCYSTDPWTQRMYGGRVAYAVQSINVGPQQGYFFDCEQGADHSYQNYHEHQVVDDIGPYYTAGAGFY
jgi:hypothetical protein